jgi:3D (Asp-Asp-Asp) domain-containing protein
MSVLAAMVGAWSMLVQIVASAPVVESSLHENPAPVYQATVSAYSCDAHPANRMHPCGPFRDGTRPSPVLHGLVAAGPYEWLGRTVYIEGYGAVTLVDTPRTPWYGDSPHIDLFMEFDDAVRWGIQERQAWTR